MKSKLKIAFVYDDSLDGSEGVAQYVKNLGSWLHKRGHRISYLVGQTSADKYDDSPIYSLAKNIKVRFNGNHLSIPLRASLNGIDIALNYEKPDIVHIQMPHSPLMGQKIIARAHKNSTIIGTFHIFPANLLVSISSRLLKILYGRRLNSIDQILSVSPPAQQFAQKAFGLSSTVVPNMVDVSRFKDGASSPTNSIVFLGRLVERKGAKYLIEAFSIIAKDDPTLRLLIAGDGPDKQSLINRVAELDLTKKIEFLGFVSEEKKINLLSSARIACFPSLYGESFGIVLIEAMAAGAQVVIGGNNPGYASVLKDSRTLFNPKDVNEFASKMNYLLKDKPQANALHKYQQTEFKKYDIETVGAAIEQIYYQQIAKTADRRHN